MSDKFDVQDHIRFRNERYLKVNLGNPRLLGLGTVEINPTELCNRTCSFCPRSDPTVYPNQNLQMSLDTVSNLCASLKAANFTGDIHITGFGEPVLNPKILDIIKITSSYFHTEIITNGDRLISGHYTHQQFKEAGLGLLIVDCYDGPDHVTQMKKLLEDCEIPYRIRNHHDTGTPELIKEYNYNNRGGLVQKEETVFRPCWMPFYKVFIDWNGDVRLCCNDWARKQQPFGNVNNEDFEDVWNNAEFIEVRKKLDKGERSKLPACKNCNTNGTKYGFESVALWQKQFM